MKKHVPVIISRDAVAMLIYQIGIRQGLDQIAAWRQAQECTGIDLYTILTIVEAIDGIEAQLKAG